MAIGKLQSTLTVATRRLSKMMPTYSALTPCMAYLTTPNPYFSQTLPAGALRR
jgi:hypothetical protein